MQQAFPILYDDEAVWKVDVATTLEIDLGSYQLISSIIAKKSGRGTLTLEVMKQYVINKEYGKLVDNIELTNEDSQFEEKLVKKFVPVRRITVKVETLGAEFKYFGIRTLEQTPFLLQHQSSQMYLGANSIDKLLYLHPYNCQTMMTTSWYCEQGLLRTSNGFYLTFQTKGEFDRNDDHHNDVIVDNSAVLIPSTSYTNIIPERRTSINFTDNRIIFVVDEKKYLMNAKGFPTISFLSEANEQPNENSIMMTESIFSGEN